MKKIILGSEYEFSKGYNPTFYRLYAKKGLPIQEADIDNLKKGNEYEIICIDYDKEIERLYILIKLISKD